MSLKNWPIPPSLSVFEDANWNCLPPASYYPKEKCTFSIPLASESIFVLSRGPFSAGTLGIVQDPSQDAVRVDVVVQYLERFPAQYVRVCKVQDGDGGWGVGVFVCVSPLM